MIPSSDLLTMASSDDSTMAARRRAAAAARLLASNRRRSVTSRKTSTHAADVALPVPDRGGAVVDRPLRAVPGDQDGVVRQPDDDAPPAGRAGTGFSTGWRVCSLTMRKTASSGRPRASSCVQPVSASATAFEERHPALGVGGDDRIADAGERGPQPLPLLVDRLLISPGPPLGDPHGLCEADDDAAGDEVSQEADQVAGDVEAERPTGFGEEVVASEVAEGHGEEGGPVAAVPGGDRHSPKERGERQVIAE